MEHIGKIIKIDRDKGFGFINSEIDNNSYYFKTISLRGEIQLDDKVAFNIENRNGKKYAIAIRKVTIFQTKSGLKFISEINSPFIHKGVESYLTDILEQVPEFDTQRIVKEFEFPSIIGKTICVQTNEDDEIFYAIKKGRGGHTRFVLNREPIDSKHITIVLQNGSTYYIIISAYIGKEAKPEPWDKQALPDAFEFWENHALIYSSEEIILESKTYICPWVLNQPAIFRFTPNTKLLRKKERS